MSTPDGAPPQDGGARKRKAKKKSKSKGGQSQNVNDKPTLSALLQPTNLRKMMTGSVVPGPKASIADVVSHEANKMVIFKLVFTSFLMLTLPFAVYFVCIAGLPRLYPLMEENQIQLIGGVSSVIMVMLIMVGYVVAALLEED